MTPPAPPRITVALSVHNDAATVAAAIESILAQTFKDFEFLIVNDGSSDQSGAIIDAYAVIDPRIRAIHQPNRGLIASLNRLVAEARGDLIARMDGDDISLPGRFAAQVVFLDAHPDHGVLGTNTNEIDEADRITLCTDLHPLDHKAVAAALRRGSPVAHSSVMMRTAVVRAAGGYRAAYRHCEDYDLWLRLSERTRIANLPDRLLLYRRSSGQVSVRHVVEQQTGAAIARLAHRERLAGRRDPTDGLDRLPDLSGLDALFGRSGVAREVRGGLAQTIVYSREALRGGGLDLLIAHVAAGGGRAGLWRTVVRLIVFGDIARALRLAAALLAPRRFAA
jgi:glycosyltransferase involved in cell wall biosynthesis